MLFFALPSNSGLILQSTPLTHHFVFLVLVLFAPHMHCCRIIFRLFAGRLQSLTFSICGSALLENTSAVPDSWKWFMNACSDSPLYSCWKLRLGNLMKMQNSAFSGSLEWFKFLQCVVHLRVTRRLRDAAALLWKDDFFFQVNPFFHPWWQHKYVSPGSVSFTRSTRGGIEGGENICKESPSFDVVT